MMTVSSDDDELERLRKRCIQLEAKLQAVVSGNGEPSNETAREAALRAFQAISTPMVLTDPYLPDNPIVFANSGFYELTGYSAEEILGRNCRFLQADGTNSETVSQIRSAVSAQKPLTVALVNYRKDGTPFLNNLHISPVYSPEGKLLFFFGGQVDVSEISAIDSRLEASRQDYRSLFDAMGEGVAVIEFAGDETDADYIHVDSNHAFFTQSGLQDAIGRSARELFPDEAEDWIRIYRRVLDTGEAVRFERIFVKTGRIFEISAYRVQPETMRRVLVLIRDITDQRENEGKLGVLTRHLDALVRSSSEVRYQLNADWSELFELSGGGFIQDTSTANPDWFHEYIPETDRAAVRGEIERAVAEKDMYSIEHRVHLVDGTIGWARSRAVPIFDEAGIVTSWIGSASDITEQKRAEEKLQIANRELSHRIKNILTITQVITNQTLRNSSDIESARKNISDRLVALSRAQNVLVSADWEEVSIEKVIENALEPHRSVDNQFFLHGENVSLTSQQAWGLSLALHELATNSVKHGALSVDTGRVRISWSSSERFTFSWVEEGGPVVRQPHRRGFGSRLIEGAVGSYFTGSARLEFDPDGVRYLIVGALPRPSAQNT